MKKIILLITIIILSMFIGPKLVSSNYLNGKIEKSIEKENNIDIKSEKAKLGLLPYPKITLKRANIDYKLNEIAQQIIADEIIILPEILPFLMGEIKIKKILVKSGNIDFKDANNRPLALLKRSEIEVKLLGSNIDFKAKSKESKTSFEISFDPKNYKNFSLNIVHPNLMLSVKDEKFNMQTENLANAIKYFTDYQTKAINYIDGKIEISGNYSATNDDFKITKARIDGENIKGEMDLDYLHNSPLKAYLKINELKINDIDKIEDKKFNDTEIKLSYVMNLNLNIDIDKLIYQNIDLLSDFNLKMNIENDFGRLENFTANIKDGGKLVINKGEVNLLKTNNEAIFKGLFSLSLNNGAPLMNYFFANNNFSKNNLVAEANVKIKDNKFIFDDLISSFGDIIITGKIITDYDSDFTSLELNSDAINLDALGVSENISTKFANYFFGDDEWVKNFHSYLMRYPGKIDYNLKINNLKFNDHIFKDFQLHNKIYKGNLDLINFSIKDNETIDLSMVGSLNVIALQPIIALRINGNFFDTKFIDYVMANKLKEAISNKFKQEKPDFSFIIPNLKLFEGYVNLTLSKLQHDDIIFENLIMQNLMNGSFIQIKDASAKLYNGELKFYGDINNNPPSFNIYYSLGSAESAYLANKFLGINTINGPISLGGTISSYGHNKKDLMNQLNLNMQLIGKNVRVTSFGIDNLSKTVSIIYNNKKRQEIDEMIKWAQNNGETLFTDLRAQIAGNFGNFKIDNVSALSKYNAYNLLSGNINLPQNSTELGIEASFRVSNTNIMPIKYQINYSKKFEDTKVSIDGTNLIRFLKDYVPN